MEEEKLGKTDLKANLTNVKPEEWHDCGQGGEGETQVGQGQHREKQVHGLVERWFCADDSENGSISHDRDRVETAERDGDPDVGSLKSRYAGEDEVERVFGGVYHFGHAR